MRQQPSTSPRDEPGETRDQYLWTPGSCRSNPDDEARCGNEAVVRTEHSGAQPADAMNHVDFGMGESAHLKRAFRAVLR